MTIASGLRSANQHFIVPTPDDLTTAHGVSIVHDLYLMAHSSQLQGNIGGNGTLQLYPVSYTHLTLPTIRLV